MSKNYWACLVTVAAIALISGGIYIHLFQKSPEFPNTVAKLKHSYAMHNDIVTAVRFVKGDSILISSSVDSTIKVWNRFTGKAVAVLRHPHGVTNMDVDSSGSFIVSSSYDGVVRVWNIVEQRSLIEFRGHKGTVWTVAFSKDGKCIASAGEDKSVKVWDRITGKLVKSFESHNLIVWSVKFSPDGTKLASCSFDRSFNIWDLHTDKLLIKNQQHGQAIVDLAFNATGDKIATASDDGTVRIWNTADASLHRLFEVPEHIQAVAFSPDGRYLLTGGRDKTSAGELVQNFFGTSGKNKGVSARLYDLRTATLVQTFSEHSNDVNDLCFSNSGRYIATASADQTVQVWSLSK